jgi:hypothetical protein
MNANLNKLINPMRALWDELVERRLWPVAIALVVALIAVPVLLSKPAKPATPLPPAPAAANPASAAVAFQPAVTTQGKKSSEIRKNLRHFKRKNPFTPQGLGSGSSSAGGTATPTLSSATLGSTSSGSTDAGTTTTPFGGDTTSGSSGSTTPGSTTGSSGSSTKTFYYHYTADVSFGKKGEEDDKTLSEFRALPTSDNPIVVFMGVKSDGKTAVFLIAANASVDGDGSCKPSDTECTFLYMKKGDKETIEAVDTTGAITDYTLELKDIDVKRTSGPEKASTSKAERARLRRESRAHLRTVTHSFQTLGL